MRHPAKNPQLFHEAVSDFLNALDVSIERIAPFAGLHPEQLRRLGKDGKHHTLVPTAIDNLMMAPVLVGRPVAPEVRGAWEKHLKVSSLYTILVLAAHRRTQSKWPQTTRDYAFVWDVATDMALYSKYTVYYLRDGSYQNRELGFELDSAVIYERWFKLQVETEEDLVAAMREADKRTGGASGGQTGPYEPRS